MLEKAVPKPINNSEINDKMRLGKDNQEAWWYSYRKNSAQKFYSVAILAQSTLAQVDSSKLNSSLPLPYRRQGHPYYRNFQQPSFVQHFQHRSGVFRQIGHPIQLQEVG